MIQDEIPKGVARIYYPWWGNADIQNRLYVLESPDGELEDYYDRKTLVAQAKKKGWKYQVERWHRKKGKRGTFTIIEKNY